MYIYEQWSCNKHKLAEANQGAAGAVMQINEADTVVNARSLWKGAMTLG